MKTRKVSTGSVVAYLGPGTQLTGGIQFEHALRLDGRVRGGRLKGHTLLVGTDADVEGRIEVDVLSVQGRVSGEIRVRERLEILAGGRVEGSVKIEGPGLVLEEGGSLEGNVEILDPADSDLANHPKTTP
jgi:cytoskeletal protein CcmA (bactofilin family)